MNGASVLDGTPHGLNLPATVSLLAGQTTTLRGDIVNAGILELDGNYYVGHATLLVTGTTTLSGAGSVILRDLNPGTQSAAAAGLITGTTVADTLDNIDNTIRGYGALGAGKLTFTNESAGVVDTTASMLTIDTGAGALTNFGLLEAVGGTLGIASAVANSGTILAGAGGTVTLRGKVTSADGNVQAGDGGTIVLDGGSLAGTGTLGSTALGTVTVLTTGKIDGTSETVSLAGALGVVAGAVLTLTGDVQNTGTMSLNGYYSIGPAKLLIAGTTTLSGAGSMILQDTNPGTLSANAAGVITGTTVADTFDSDNVIRGYGALGAGELTFINEKAGVVDATASTLTLDTGLGTTTNLGLLEAVGGTLVINSAVIHNGTILAGSNGCVVLRGAVTGADGQIQASDKGTIVLDGGSLAGSNAVSSTVLGMITVATTGELDGTTHTLALAGTSGVDASAVLTLTGSVRNTGTISLNGYYYSDP